MQAALDLAGPDRIPRDVWGWRYIARLRPSEWNVLLDRFPMDFARPQPVLGPSSRAQGDCSTGCRVDDWGSVWTTLQDGVSGEVTQPALADWSDLDAFSPPWEMVETSALEDVDDFCRSTDSYTIGEMGQGPFERMQFLRGTENLFCDLAEQSSRFTRLLEMVHEFSIRHVKLWCKSGVDSVAMGDDWGSQTALLISPDMWRRLFRPLYAEYFDLIHRAGKRVFFHSDGMVREIIPDLIDIGADALNCQVFCMDIEELGRTFRGRITFWGEIDRQFILPFGSDEDVRRSVKRVSAALGSRMGGLIAQLSWGVTDPSENVMAAFEEWETAFAQG